MYYVFYHVLSSSLVLGSTDHDVDSIGGWALADGELSALGLGGSLHAHRGCTPVLHLHITRQPHTHHTLSHIANIDYAL